MSPHALPASLARAAGLLALEFLLMPLSVRTAQAAQLCNGYQPTLLASKDSQVVQDDDDSTTTVFYTITYSRDQTDVIDAPLCLVNVSFGGASGECMSGSTFVGSMTYNFMGNIGRVSPFVATGALQVKPTSCPAGSTASLILNLQQTTKAGTTVVQSLTLNFTHAASPSPGAGKVRAAVTRSTAKAAPKAQAIPAKSTD